MDRGFPTISNLLNSFKHSENLQKISAMSKKSTLILSKNNLTLSKNNLTIFKLLKTCFITCINICKCPVVTDLVFALVVSV